MHPLYSNLSSCNSTESICISIVTATSYQIHSICIDKTAPIQVIELGLAIINPASAPNTSIVPSKSLPLVPVTCNRIRDASLPAVILLLPVTAVLH